MFKFKRRGATLLSYGLVVGLISVVALSTVTTVGSSVDDLMTDVSNSLSESTGTAGAAGAGAEATPAPTPVDNFILTHNDNESFYTLTMPGQGPGSTCTATHTGGATGNDSFEPAWDCSEDVINMKVRFAQRDGNYGGGTQAVTLNTSLWQAGLISATILSNGSPVHTESNFIGCTPTSSGLQPSDELDEDCDSRFGESSADSSATYSLNPLTVQVNGVTRQFQIDNDNNKICECYAPDDGRFYQFQSGGGNALTSGTLAFIDNDCNVTEAPATGVRSSVNCTARLFD